MTTKTIYQKPETEVIDFDFLQLLAGSNTNTQQATYGENQNQEVISTDDNESETSRAPYFPGMD